jgi:hypothetical protein
VSAALWFLLFLFLCFFFSAPSLFDATLPCSQQITNAAKGLIGQRVRTLSENDVLHSCTSSNNLSPSAGSRHMDLEEFIHIAKFDEVLVDVFSKDAHQRLFSLFQRAEGTYRAHRELWDRQHTPVASTPTSTSMFSWGIAEDSPRGGKSVATGASTTKAHDSAREAALMEAVKAEVRQILDDPTF